MACNQKAACQNKAINQHNQRQIASVLYLHHCVESHPTLRGSRLVGLRAIVHSEVLRSCRDFQIAWIVTLDALYYLHRQCARKQGVFAVRLRSSAPARVCNRTQAVNKKRGLSTLP